MIYCDKTEESIYVNALLKFSGLSNIPSDSTITSVTLGLRQTGGNSYQVINIYRLLVNWVEGTQNGDVNTADNPDSSCWNEYGSGNDWNTAGGTGSGTDRSATISGTLTSSNGSWITVTDTAGQLLTDVQNFVNGTYDNYGWILWNNTTGGYEEFVSSEGTDNQRPYLSVTYEPAAGGASIPRSNPFSRPFSQSLGRGGF